MLHFPGEHAPGTPQHVMYRTSSTQKPQNIGLMQIQSKHANKHVPSTKQFIEKKEKYMNKHLMTRHQGNSEFDSPRRSMFPEAKSRGTLRSSGNKTHCFSKGQSLSVLLYLPTQKQKKLRKKFICLRPLHTLAALAKLSGCRKQPVLSKNNDNSLFPRS